MNGAESLLHTLYGNGVDVCFANPGTSEMQFVAAVDRVEGMRCVLGLFEGVVTGAADGYGRMLGRPAATLLHLGPGLANGLSNLHNAMRAQSPIVNIIGDHATHHRALDAPLTSDVEGTARPFSHWVRTSPSADTLALDTTAAVAAARSSPGRIASLIVPADATWTEVTQTLFRAPSADELVVHPDRPAERLIAAAGRMLSEQTATAIILGGHAGRAECLEVAGKIAAATGAKLLAQTYLPRVARGAGRVIVERIPFGIDEALKVLAGFSNIILVGAKPPVAFFAYPDRPGLLLAPGARVLELANVSQDAHYALEALAERVGAQKTPPPLAPLELPDRPSGAITPAKIGLLLAATLPSEAIVIDESITTGRTFLHATRTSHPHDWILPTGGSIGFALATAAGAAIACPERKVIALESDGSGMYMPQALWTHARESLNILSIVFANRKYQILRAEMSKTGVRSVGPKASTLLDIDRPTIDWVALARSLGVEASRAGSMEELSRLVEAGLAHQGPRLIEVVL